MMYSRCEFIKHCLIFFGSSGLGSVKGELSSLTEDAETWTVHLPFTIQEQPMHEK